MVVAEKSYFTYMMPYGHLTIGASKTGVTQVRFGAVEMEGAYKATKLTNQAANQLMQYFAHKRDGFTVALDLTCSDFQRAVWEALQASAYGQPVTSAQIAAALGKPQAYRSVGAALKDNPVPIIIPDHRVVNAQGDHLGTGKDRALRKALLAFEQEGLKV